ncbi:ATP-binding protein [Nocardioides sp. YIM 152588]|uniref:AAA family ATPase n=1 Tax=Nocardioides sp. YIM 152588 TaxID=3158259 RepID=UPI0032E3ED14
MILWLNGTFGVGKTTTGARLAEASPRFRHFDPEWVGYMLANNLADHQVSDFQHYPSWRRLVPVVADEIAGFTGQDLVAAQSVLVESYWHEIRGGLASLGHDVLHVVLDADAATLHARIDADDEEPERVRPWRHRHVDTYRSARSWLVDSADLVVDTATHDAAATAHRIIDAVAARR